MTKSGGKEAGWARAESVSIPFQSAPDRSIDYRMAARAALARKPERVSPCARA